MSEENKLEIEWPWEMVCVDEVIAQIKESLPPDHELQKHDLYPGIKWDGRLVFIVDDDTTGQQFLMNFENRKRWKKTKFKVPEIKVFKNLEEVAEMIARDHLAECAKYNDEGLLR